MPASIAAPLKLSPVNPRRLPETDAHTHTHTCTQATQTEIDGERVGIMEESLTGLTRWQLLKWASASGRWRWGLQGSLTDHHSNLSEKISAKRFSAQFFNSWNDFFFVFLTLWHADLLVCKKKSILIGWLPKKLIKYRKNRVPLPQYSCLCLATAFSGNQQGDCDLECPQRRPGGQKTGGDTKMEVMTEGGGMWDSDGPLPLGLERH